MDKPIKSVNSCRALASQDQEDKTPSISTLPYNGKVRSRVDSSFFKGGQRKHYPSLCLILFHEELRVRLNYQPFSSHLEPKNDFREFQYKNSIIIIFIKAQIA